MGKVAPVIFGSLILASIRLTNSCAASLVIADAGVAIVIDPATALQTVDQISVLMSPFVQSHSIEVGNSTCAAQYNWTWEGDSGDFYIATQQRLQGFKGGTSSGGGFLLTPSTDSIFNTVGYFHYNHPPQLMGLAVTGVTLRIDSTNQIVFQDFDSDGTLGLGPPAGTLTIDGSAILNAGTTYSLGFQFTTDNFAIPPAQAAWLGDGEIYMSIRPIPEPAALLPLAFAALFLRRHKSHRLP